jgi:hypothetical protein
MSSGYIWTADPRKIKRATLEAIFDGGGVGLVSKSPALARLCADDVLEKSIQHAVDREATL